MLADKLAVTIPMTGRQVRQEMLAGGANTVALVAGEDYPAETGNTNLARPMWRIKRPHSSAPPNVEMAAHGDAALLHCVTPFERF
jgi:hypothetical protein